MTGATGSVGPKLVNRLCEKSYRVRTLSIDEPEPDLFPKDVEAKIRDITDAAAVRAAMEGINIVFHLAALLHIAKPTEFQQREYTRININGTKTIVEAAKQAE